MMFLLLLHHVKTFDKKKWLLNAAFLAWRSIKIIKFTFRNILTDHRNTLNIEDNNNNKTYHRRNTPTSYSSTLKLLIYQLPRLHI